MNGTVSKEELFECVLDTSNVPQTARKAKKMWLGRNLTRTSVGLVWSSMCKHIKTQMSHGKGVSVLNFGKFAPNTADNDRALLLLSDAFNRQYKSSQLKKPIRFGTVLDVNYTQISLETGVPKDDVKTLIAELVNQLGEAVAGGKRSVMVDFTPLGTFYAHNRRVQFEFGDRGSFSTRMIQKERIAWGQITAPSFSRSTPESARGLSIGIGIVSADTNVTNHTIIEEKDEEEDQQQTQDFIPRLVLPLAPSSPPRSESANCASCDRSSSSNSSNRGLVDHKNADDVRIVYPVFLDRDPRNALNKYDVVHDEKMDRRSGPMDLNIGIAFERTEKQLQKSIDELKSEDLDIIRRNKLSQMAYLQRQLDAKQETLNTNEFLMQQTAERRARANQERTALRGTGKIIAETSGAGPFPVDKLPDYAGVARSKRELRKALQGQVRDKQRRGRNEHAKTVAEERYLVDCNIKLMQADRAANAKRKEETRKQLQTQWERQTKLAQMQKLLVQAKNGKILAHSQSEDGLLTVRSIRQ